MVGHHRAAVAVAAERLSRKKTRSCGVAEGANPPVIEGHAEALGGVVEDKQAFCLGGFSYRGVVGRQTKQVDRNHYLRGKARSFCSRDSACNAAHVDIECG